MFAGCCPREPNEIDWLCHFSSWNDLGIAITSYIIVYWLSLRMEYPFLFICTHNSLLFCTFFLQNFCFFKLFHTINSTHTRKHDREFTKTICCWYIGLNVLAPYNEFRWNLSYINVKAHNELNENVFFIFSFKPFSSKLVKFTIYNQINFM